VPVARRPPRQVEELRARSRARARASTPPVRGERRAEREQGCRAVAHELEQRTARRFAPWPDDEDTRPTLVTGVETGRLAGSRRLDDRPPW